MNDPKPIETATNADLRNSHAALLRAARRARELAARTGTAIVVVRNGVLEHIHPTPEAPAESKIQDPHAPPYGKQR
ncbi:hypothetical protein [Thioalkalivibrio paradoxus]|uniref:Uncharacterized protein n=1 Tax=Thioalkalivibrio paradoxus ARh 1 TaxID=713585 RepID=W0DIT4_9GAMM|nr:hypothetical protein [Thioalkalivibrio paradoxus]AHE98351.1 hypothetical protein THITH_08855 [Thioalkalivibrio paradoxus ARh 1]